MLQSLPRSKAMGLYAIFDGHLGDNVVSYLQNKLFANILSELSDQIAR